HLHGAWAREMQISTQVLRPGMQSVESRRGASSHAHNPFFALTEQDAHEEYGAAYGFNLVYSGNFLAAVELDPYSSPRAQIGLNPFDFSWKLEPKQSFQTPEAVLAFSSAGIGGMSRALHRFYRQHLLPKTWRKRKRPILLNSWEATYFDFTADKIEVMARDAADLGIELLVIDDGWFGKRENEKTSMGDWVANERKFPHGLADLVHKVRACGLQLGLWFEPEMVSVDSDFYRAHPDWCLHVPTHSRTEGRHALVLDLSRSEVREEIFNRIAGVLRSAPISYVKWDMNRNMTEIGSANREPDRQQETAHRYMLGLYELLERFQKEFPDILIEGCSGGGGRFDPGILHYMPQIWTTDNTDAIARLRIQYGTSLIYPLSSMSAHVSTVPNHQVGRITPLRTRGQVAFTGTFGYELDVASLSDEEKIEIRQQIASYKLRQELLVEGDLYRLRSPFESNESAWIVVSPDKSEALATHVNVLAEANPPSTRLQLRGLDRNSLYLINDENLSLRGDYLMQIGLPIPEPQADFVSHQWYLRKL
ncbi:MAG: alpha-galactosidase, partial [Terrimicrobiaceae bacterium]